MGRRFTAGQAVRSLNSRKTKGKYSRLRPRRKGGGRQKTEKRPNVGLRVSVLQCLEIN